MRIQVGQLSTYNIDNETCCVDINGESVGIDVLICDLIIKLNKAGFATEYCCSGHSDDLYTGFYIKFKRLDEPYMSKLISIVQQISQLICTSDYTVVPQFDDDISSPSNIQVICMNNDPSVETDIEFARAIILEKLKNEDYYDKIKAIDAYETITVRLRSFRENFILKTKLSKQEYETYKLRVIHEKLIDLYMMIKNFERLLDKI